MRSGPCPSGIDEDRQADRQDQAVQAANEDQHLRRWRGDDHVEEQRDGDEDHGCDIAGALADVLLEDGDERYRRIGGADHRGDGGKPQNGTEDAVAGLACGCLEGLCRRIGTLARHVDDDAAGDHAENGKEQHVAHQAGDGDTSQCRTVDGAEVLDADGALVEQAMCAGIGDVAADRATDDGGDRGKIDGGGKEGLEQRIADRRARDDRDIERQKDHQDAGDDDQAVDGKAGPFGAENADGDQRTDCPAPFCIKADHGVEAKTGAADIADVEEQPADDDEDGEQVTGARNGRIGNVGCAHLRQRHDPPDVQLHDEIDEDGSKNRKGEGSAELACEGGRLGDEAWTDGRCRHQKDGSDECGTPRFG